MNEYTVEEYTADIGVSAYIARFRDAERFMACCKACPNYGKSWGCPPFGFDTDRMLRRYQHARLFATKISPTYTEMPLSEAQSFLRAERMRIERQLLTLERRYGGRAFAYIGECLHCPGGLCRRSCGLPCLHPDKVRPSLEAFGFDIGRTLSELFGIRLLWGKGGMLPEYLVLVSGFFYNGRMLSHLDTLGARCGERN